MVSWMAWMLGSMFSAQMLSTFARPSLENCTFMWFEQPLDHFNGVDKSFQQRVCVYDRFWKEKRASDTKDVMLFYAGNESPVDLYVNNTGLMWSLGEELGALVVFAEHRYFGESIPTLRGQERCMAYVNSAQALADYATLVPELKRRVGMHAEAKVVAFGGSYGGMLAAWFRMKYPHICTGGAVAASAPVFGYASTHAPLDGAFQAISKGAEDQSGIFSQQCQDSYLSTWILIQYLWTEFGEEGKAFLSHELGLCSSGGTSRDIIRGLQDILFLLGESNFPFPSDYIVYAIINKKGFPLPAWPMRAACKHVTRPIEEVQLSGSRREVRYTVSIKLSPSYTLGISVNWDSAKPKEMFSKSEVFESSVVKQMLRGIRNVYGMLYNITGETQCFNLSGEATANEHDETEEKRNKEEVCEFDTVGTMDAWNAIVCNEGLALVIDTARGLGADMYWPPDAPRGADYIDTVAKANALGYCGNTLPGVTKKQSLLDPFGRWALSQYQGKEFAKYSSNIIFSNGKYDPWSGAGVFGNYPNGIETVFLEHGAHHTDLMFDSDFDPPSILAAREKEKKIIRSWLGESFTRKEYVAKDRTSLEKELVSLV